MPELPEVETIRRDLTPRIVGRTIAEAWVSPDAPKLVQDEPADAFCRRLTGRRQAVDQRTRPRLKSRTISRAALCPGSPVTPPPGCAPAPHRYNPASGMR